VPIPHHTTKAADVVAFMARNKTTVGAPGGMLVEGLELLIRFCKRCGKQEVAWFLMRRLRKEGHEGVEELCVRHAREMGDL